MIITNTTQSLQHYVDLALAKHSLDENPSMLTIVEFIEVTNYNISKLYIDKFWASMRDDQWVYVDDDLLRWMGFEAIKPSHRKNGFINLMKTNGISYTEFNNKQYTQFLNGIISVPIYNGTEMIASDCLSSNTNVVLVSANTRIVDEAVLFPPPPDGKGTGKTKHILLDCRAFKEAAMTIGRGKGKHVREYYLAVEDLFKAYDRYQRQVIALQRKRDRELLEAKNNELETQSKQLVIFKQESDVSKQELEISKQLLMAKEQESDMSRQALEAQNKQLELSKQLLMAKEQEIAEKDKRLVNTELVNSELLAYKLFIGRNETLYIITSRSYARYGYFKVGKTKSLSAKDRLLTMNTGHIPGDDLIVVAEFKTNNAKQLESRVHEIMQHHRVTSSREWFRLPFKYIYRVCAALNENHHLEQELMNEITQMLYEISCKDPSQICWEEDMPLMLEDAPTQLLIEAASPAVDDRAEVEPRPLQTAPLVSPPPSTQCESLQPNLLQPNLPQPNLSQPPQQASQTIQFTFNVGGWTAEQTHEFVVKLLTTYKIEMESTKKKPSWTTLSMYLTKGLQKASNKKKIGIKNAREQIVRLCNENNIVIK